MTEKFNADFYVTCATVIPVLFLAAAVQGQAFVFVLQRARRRTARQRRWITLRFFRLRIAAIVIAGIVGEPIALWALYGESEKSWQRPTVLVATLILLLAVAAAPIGAYADHVAQFLDQALEGRPERTVPGEARLPAISTDNNPSAVTRKVVGVIDARQIYRHAQRPGARGGAPEFA